MASDFPKRHQPHRPQPTGTGWFWACLPHSPGPQHSAVSARCASADSRAREFHSAHPVAWRRERRLSLSPSGTSGWTARSPAICIPLEPWRPYTRSSKCPTRVLFVFTEGTERVHLGEFNQIEPFMTASVEQIAEIAPEKSAEVEALQRNVTAQFQQIVTASPTLSDELQTIALNIEDPGRLADFIISSLPFLSTTDKQELLGDS